jgi:hypothetical protein
LKFQELLRDNKSFVARSGIQAQVGVMLENLLLWLANSSAAKL